MHDPDSRPVVRRAIRRRSMPMTAEAKRLIEERTRMAIDAAIAAGKVTQCAARWATGSVPTPMFPNEL